MDYSYNFEYDYPVITEMAGMRAVTLILTIYLIALALIIAVALASYIFHSIRPVHYRKTYGKRACMACFVPFAERLFSRRTCRGDSSEEQKYQKPGNMETGPFLLSTVLLQEYSWYFFSWRRWEQERY